MQIAKPNLLSSSTSSSIHLSKSHLPSSMAPPPLPVCQSWVFSRDSRLEKELNYFAFSFPTSSTFIFTLSHSRFHLHLQARQSSSSSHHQLAIKILHLQGQIEVRGWFYSAFIYVPTLFFLGISSNSFWAGELGESAAVALLYWPWLQLLLLHFVLLWK